MEMAGFVQIESTNILTLFKVAERTLLLFPPLPLAAKRYWKSLKSSLKKLHENLFPFWELLLSLSKLESIESNCEENTSGFLGKPRRL